jgi:hypothetical protein
MDLEQALLRRNTTALPRPRLIRTFAGRRRPMPSLVLLSLSLFTLAAPADAPPGVVLNLELRLASTSEAASPDRVVSRMERLHRPLEWATLGLLAGSAAGGLVATLNQPTLFGEGRCARGEGIFGDYGCDGFSIVHGGAGVLTTLSYTATRLIGWGLEDAGVRRPGPLQRALGWTHLVSMALQPALGIVGGQPQVLGITDPDRARSFSESVRTIHVVTGLLTLGTFAASTLLDVER